MQCKTSLTVLHARYSSIHGLSSRLVVYHALFENYLASISTS